MISLFCMNDKVYCTSKEGYLRFHGHVSSPVYLEDKVEEIFPDYRMEVYNLLHEFKFNQYNSYKPKDYNKIINEILDKQNILLMIDGKGKILE